MVPWSRIKGVLCFASLNRTPSLVEGESVTLPANPNYELLMRSALPMLMAPPLREAMSRGSEVLAEKRVEPPCTETVRPA